MENVQKKEDLHVTGVGRGVALPGNIETLDKSALQENITAHEVNPKAKLVTEDKDESFAKVHLDRTEPKVVLGKMDRRLVIFNEDVASESVAVESNSGEEYLSAVGITSEEYVEAMSEDEPETDVNF